MRYPVKQTRSQAETQVYHSLKNHTKIFLKSDLKVGAGCNPGPKRKPGSEERVAEGSWEMDAVKTLRTCVELRQ